MRDSVLQQSTKLASPTRRVAQTESLGSLHEDPSNPPSSGVRLLNGMCIYISQGTCTADRWLSEANGPAATLVIVPRPNVLRI